MEQIENIKEEELEALYDYVNTFFDELPKEEQENWTELFITLEKLLEDEKTKSSNS